MSTENKYYTPEISEYHIGFEYEWRNKPKAKSPLEEANEGIISAIDLIAYGGMAPLNVREAYERRYQESITWKKAVLTEEMFEFDRDGAYNDNNPLFSWYNSLEFRVKFLDKEDIEAEGWKAKVISNGSGYFTQIKDKKEYTLGFHSSDPKSPLFNNVTILVFDYGNNIVLFNGIINNRSEIRKVLKMIKL